MTCCYTCYNFFNVYKLDLRMVKPCRQLLKLLILDKLIKSKFVILWCLVGNDTVAPLKFVSAFEDVLHVAVGLMQILRELLGHIQPYTMMLLLSLFSSGVFRFSPLFSPFNMYKLIQKENKEN